MPVAIMPSARTVSSLEPLKVSPNCHDGTNSFVRRWIADLPTKLFHGGFFGRFAERLVISSHQIARGNSFSSNQNDFVMAL
jgi:hypothetical protein